MVEYIDSGSGRSEEALGNWLAARVVAGLRGFRCQSGFFSLASLRDHLETLRQVEVFRLVLGSNAPEQPTAEDIRALLQLLTDPARRSLTIVSCAGAALFHPKTIHLVGPGEGATGYVGSANMTEAGLGLNIEAGVFLGPESGEALQAMADSIDAWAERTEEGVFQVRDEGDINDLLEQGVLLTAEARRAARAASRVAEGAPRRPPGFRRVRLWRPATRAAGVETGGGAGEAAAEGGPQPVEAEVSHFAMLLAPFDVSHRRGVPGTPEMSLPAELEVFFGPLGNDARNRAHAGRHFKVDIQGNGASAAVFRAWRRVGGEGGHADLRLRVNHDLIDQTNSNGGDVLHVERLAPAPGEAEYRVEVVPQTDRRYVELVARCTNTGGAKRYGLW